MTPRPTGAALTQALVDLANRGQRPRCSDPDTHHLWTSENHLDRKQAATWCAGCPVIEACAHDAALLQESFGVWAGIDRTPQHGRPRKTANNPSTTDRTGEVNAQEDR